MTIETSGVAGGAALSQFSDAMGANSLGKDAFLQLLVTQLQNQDPLQPMDNTEFVAQLAQFSSLEQLTSVNDQLSSVQLGLISSSNLQAAGLVGKEVTSRGDQFSYDGTGGTDLGFELSGEATGGEIRIYDEFGGLVRTIDLGAQPAGTVSVNWDGRTDSGTSAGAGRYRMEIEAHDAEDGSVEASTLSTGVVTGIFFDQGVAELEVEGTRVRLGDVVSISEPDTAPAGEAGAATEDE
jgi:flagellar basal-body rod modification protein FlgD